MLGLGYIVLPTGALIVKNKIKVIGGDKNNKVVDIANKGQINMA